MSARQPRVEQIFAAASEVADPAQRRAYLDRECAGDEALRAEVESLLAADAKAGDFLDHPPTALGNEGALADAAARLTERSGDRIGRYKLLEQIGEGGFGVVWMAEQEEPVRRRVALKVIKLGMDTREVVARFEAERQALALMEHPNIAKVFDAGATEGSAGCQPAVSPTASRQGAANAQGGKDPQAAQAGSPAIQQTGSLRYDSEIRAGRPYFVMELVRGIRITDYCDENNLSTVERLNLFVQVCQAVQHAHQKGIIHRDLKPSNILVTVNDGVPVPKVIDFGIAKATEQRLTDKTVFTRFMQFLGTPAYMSPEQAELTSLDIDTRSDIYSLGVLLYELLTGRTPFDAKELLEVGLDEMRRTIREKEPLRPSTRLSAMSAVDLTIVAKRRQTEAPKLIHLLRGDLDWIVIKCLEKDRTRRYETANGLARDIQRHLDYEPVAAGAPSNLYRFQRLVRRNRVVFAAGGAVAVALIAGLAASLLLFFKERAAHGRAVDAERAQTSLAQELEGKKEIAERRLWDSYLAQARALRWSGRAGRRFEGLEVLARAAAMRPSLELRNEAIALLALTDVRPGSRLPQPPGFRGQCNIDSQFGRYALTDETGNISVRRFADASEAAFLPGFGWKVVVWWFSPSGRFLAVKHDGPGGNRVQIWDIDRQQAALKLTNAIADAALDFHPGEAMVAVGHTGGTISIHDLRSGEVNQRLATGVKPHSLRFSPGGESLAMSSLSKSVLILDLKQGTVVRTLRHEGGVRGMAWQPEGELLATACADRRVYLWDVAKSKLWGTLSAHQGEATQVAFTPDGELLASVGWDNMLHLWDPLNQEPLLGFSAKNAALQFDPSGHWLGLSSDVNSFSVLEVNGGRECRTLAQQVKRRVWSGAFTADGRILAVAVGDGIALWDITRRTQAGYVRFPLAISVQFTTDGTELVASGGYGFQRWPIHVNAGKDTELLIGPAEQLEMKDSTETMCLIPGTRKVAVAHRSVSHIVDLDKPSEPALPLPHSRAGSISSSPDGKWIATGTWNGEDVIIWEATSGKRHTSLPIKGSAHVLFSPDGRWLVTAPRGEYQIREVGSWKLHRQVSAEAISGGPMAFSPDGRILAIRKSSQVVQLLDPEQARELASVPAERAVPLCFSTDSTLLVVGEHGTTVRVWDLRLVREKLATLNLDWELPPYPQKTSIFSGAIRIHVEEESGKPSRTE